MAAGQVECDKDDNWGQEITLTRCRANDDARKMKAVYALGGMIYNDMQHADISESRCNVLDLAFLLSPSATAFTAVDRGGLSGVLLCVYQRSSV
jgi:hypothetical protein